MTYPERNFTSKVLLAFEDRSASDWEEKYGDKVLAFESLVELPRSGELYRRAGYTKIGTTQGITCRRVPGNSPSEKWKGRRVWDYDNPRPKYVFCKRWNG